ncbi:hypothetical protein CYANOKiyG1_45340 [Okeania sp. KiyG1]|nr:hypothetical protein CYANOKiyG1_45340 [Okeania sp. KiyG1]
MLVYEMKLEGEKAQYEKLDEAIRTGRFVRNSIVRAWMDGQVKSRIGCLQILQNISR